MVLQEVAGQRGRDSHPGGADSLRRGGEGLRGGPPPERLEARLRLTTSDHCYYTCTKRFADGDVHKYFNPYDSPYDSYINFMNVLDHLQGRCEARERSGAAAGSFQSAGESRVPVPA